MSCSVSVLLVPTSLIVEVSLTIATRKSLEVIVICRNNLQVCRK
uniref:Uncharacterized protein n=1 Tax=Anguilla anguilla TaxID=7936 RepID=A0A0E9VF79_ANGAN